MTHHFKNQSPHKTQICPQACLFPNQKPARGPLGQTSAFITAAGLLDFEPGLFWGLRAPWLWQGESQEWPSLHTRAPCCRRMRGHSQECAHLSPPRRQRHKCEDWDGQGGRELPRAEHSRQGRGRGVQAPHAPAGRTRAGDLTFLSVFPSLWNCGQE